MPQMAPLNWLILFIYFFSIFLIFNLLNYFFLTYNIKKKLKSKYFINYTWKW